MQGLSIYSTLTHNWFLTSSDILKPISIYKMYTVNVVIFAGGKFCKNVGKSFHVGAHDTTPVSYIKAYRFYFHVWVIFAKKTKERKTWKLLPCENFHVYSTCMSIFTLNIVLWQKPKGLNYYYIPSTICSLGITNYVNFLHLCITTILVSSGRFKGGGGQMGQCR